MVDVVLSSDYTWVTFGATCGGNGLRGYIREICNMETVKSKELQGPNVGCCRVRRKLSQQCCVYLWARLKPAIYIYLYILGRARNEIDRNAGDDSYHTFSRNAQHGLSERCIPSTRLHAWRKACWMTRTRSW